MNSDSLLPCCKAELRRKKGVRAHYADYWRRKGTLSPVLLRSADIYYQIGYTLLGSHYQPESFTRDMPDETNQRPKLHAEMLVGISAVIIGVCALAVSLYETSLMREEQRAAVMPLLELSRSYNVRTDESAGEKSRLLLQAQNVGIGPARVVDFRVTVDGESHATWDSALRRLIEHDSRIAYGQSTINGRTIPPERMVTMMALNDAELVEEILAEFDRLDFEACFCSIFDECWTTSFSAFGAASPVESCQRSDGSFTE